MALMSNQLVSCHGLIRTKMNHDESVLNDPTRDGRTRDGTFHKVQFKAWMYFTNRKLDVCQKEQCNFPNIKLFYLNTNSEFQMSCPLVSFGYHQFWSRFLTPYLSDVRLVFWTNCLRRLRTVIWYFVSWRRINQLSLTSNKSVWLSLRVNGSWISWYSIDDAIAHWAVERHVVHVLMISSRKIKLRDYFKKLCRIFGFRKNHDFSRWKFH